LELLKASPMSKFIDTLSNFALAKLSEELLATFNGYSFDLKVNYLLLSPYKKIQTGANTTMKKRV